jgi:hypothetical protein
MGSVIEMETFIDNKTAVIASGKFDNCGNNRDKPLEKDGMKNLAWKTASPAPVEADEEEMGEEKSKINHFKNDAEAQKGEGIIFGINKVALRNARCEKWRRRRCLQDMDFFTKNQIKLENELKAFQQSSKRQPVHLTDCDS